MSLRVQLIDGPARGLLVTSIPAPKYLRHADARRDGWRAVERATAAPHSRLAGRSDVSADEAGARHLIQTLVGDSGEGDPGCPGVRLKMAEQSFS